MISARQRILLAGLLASAAFAASAQTPPPPSAAPPGAEAHADRHDPAKRYERMQQFRAKRLAALKQKLHITAQQEGAWSAFTAGTEIPPPKPGEHFDREAFRQMTTPQRLDRMQAMQSERAARFAKIADAVRTFYAALTPEQQKVFDAQHFGRRHERMRHEHRMHEHGAAQAPADHNG